MEKQLTRHFSPHRFLTGVIICVTIIVTIGFLGFLGTTLSGTISASTSIMTLQKEVVHDSLHRARLFHIGDLLKEKTERPPIDPKTIRDPF